MGAEIQNGEVLATWKEIAAYLKTSVRTCLRWEAQEGLPIHRQEGSSKSTVYAYKYELDSWFKTRINNGALSTRAKKPASLRPRSVLFLIILPVVIMAAGSAAFLILRGQQPTQLVIPRESDVPQSSCPLDILTGDVVESEWATAGIMRTWRKKTDESRLEVWRIEPVRHTSLAVGNLDQEPDLEIIAPGHCRETYEIEGQEATRIRFFLNAYKLDYRNWWMTTYFDPAQCVLEKENIDFTELAIGNLDQSDENEIVLSTAHKLAVFRYEPLLNEIRLVSMKDTFVNDSLPLFRSVALLDVDNDGKSEILALANEGEEERITENKSWLFLLKLMETGLELIQVIPLHGTASIHSLCVGDIVPGGTKEAIFPLYRRESDTWLASLMGWNPVEGFVIENSLDMRGSDSSNTFFVDAGELTPTYPADEIIVASSNPNILITYMWNGHKLVSGPRYSLDHRVRLNGVQIGNLTSIRSSKPCILVWGGADIEGQPGRSYLELIRYADGFLPEWFRIGGEKADLAVTCASIVFAQ